MNIDGLHGSRTRQKEDFEIMKKTQKAMILDYLKQNGTITSMQAIEKFGATRLSGIIFALRKEGYEITTLDTSIKDRYGTRKTIATYKLLSH